MQPVLNVDDIKRVEVALTREGVSVSELMHRAGCAAAQEAQGLGDADNVVVLCGMGNNGGDGWVAAEALHSRGANVTVVTPVEVDQIPGDLARQVARSASSAGVSVLVGPAKDELEALLATSDVVLDCMLGTGFHGAVRAPFDIWIECLNGSGASVVAVDVPSGLSAMSGHAEGACVVADVTVTMLALKPGLLSDDGRDVCGAIVVAPLAEQTERLVVEADPVAWRTDLADYLDVLPQQTAAQDKFSRGSVLVVAGSRRYPGVAARMGAGYVTLAVPASVAPTAQMQLLEVPVVPLPEDAEGTLVAEGRDVVLKLAERAQAVLVGPGMRVTGGTCTLVSALLASDRPLVVDADGLNCLARLTNDDLPSLPEATRRSATLVLTPHRRELGRLVGRASNPPASLSEQLEAARKIVWSDGGSELVVVAKGCASASVGVSQAVLPKPGPGALATAGSGDVLAGMMASALAQAAKGTDPVLLGAYVCEVHGYAGTLAAERMGSRAVMATDVIDVIGLAADAVAAHVSLPEGSQEA